MTKRISLIAAKNKTLARIVEISFYGSILAWLQYVGDALITGDFSNYKVAIGMVITGFVGLFPKYLSHWKWPFLELNA